MLVWEGDLLTLKMHGGQLSSTTAEGCVDCVRRKIDVSQKLFYDETVTSQ